MPRPSAARRVPAATVAAALAAVLGTAVVSAAGWPTAPPVDGLRQVATFAREPVRQPLPVAPPQPVADLTPVAAAPAGPVPTQEQRPDQPAPAAEQET